ncbi:unnamed protein product [Effrenium voratum]|nr:unnamed protein product [Effrenium voratum]
MGAKEVEDASLAAILGPLGREAALASERMREVEEWIWAAEAEGLSAEEIAPARQRLAALARDNRSINWRREEEKAAEEKAWQAELRAAAENLRRAEQEAEKELSGAQRGGGADLKVGGSDALRRERALWQKALGLLYGSGSDADVVCWELGVVACARAERTDLAVKLLRQRWARFPDWDSSVGGCGAAISACSRSGRWQLGLQLLAEARTRRQPLGDRSCNAAIGACTRIAAWSRALVLLEEVPCANTEGYNAAIGVLSEGQQWHKALCLLHLMQRREKVPDIVTYSSLLAACARGIAWQHAGLLLGAMHVRPNILSACSVLSAYARRRKWQDALRLFAELPEAPNAVAYTVAFQNAPYDSANSLAREMQRQLCRQDVLSFTSAQQACDFRELPVAERQFRREVFGPTSRVMGRGERRLPLAKPDLGPFTRDIAELCGAAGKKWRWIEKVDVKQLISARQKLLRASGVTPPPAIARGAETRSLAKDMLQAMKARDVEKLRATLDAAAAADLQLQGLEAIRRKLATWKPDKREPQTRLRIILPDGRRGWLPVEPEWLGSAVLSCVQEGDEYRLGREASTRGAVTVLEQRLQLDRPLCEQPEFLEEGATLCICQRSAPEPPAASAEWEEVVKGISEPMPSFTKVQRLLGYGQAVVLAWGDVEDRCGQVIEAVGACRLILAGQQEASWRPRLPFTAMALDVDALVTGEVVSSILAQIEAWVQRPFLLVLVSRAYLSRRLAHSFRQHLPQDIALLPCPPDLKTACAEVPEFGNRFLEEARRLQAEGLHLTQSCLDALERCGTFAHGKSCVRAAVLNGCKPYKFPRCAVVLTRIDRVEEGIVKTGKANLADRELMLRQVLDRKIEDVCVKLDVPRTGVHFIENYHSGVLGVEQEVRNISVDFHALKILSQCCSHADAFIAQALREARPAPCTVQ